MKTINEWKIEAVNELANGEWKHWVPGNGKSLPIWANEAKDLMAKNPSDEEVIKFFDERLILGD